MDACTASRAGVVAGATSHHLALFEHDEVGLFADAGSYAAGVLCHMRKAGSTYGEQAAVGDTAMACS